MMMMMMMMMMMIMIIIMIIVIIAELILMLTCAQVVAEMSVNITNKSSSRDYSHPDDQTRQTNKNNNK